MDILFAVTQYPHLATPPAHTLHCLLFFLLFLPLSFFCEQWYELTVVQLKTISTPCCSPSSSALLCAAVSAPGATKPRPFSAETVWTEVYAHTDPCPISFGAERRCVRRCVSVVFVCRLDSKILISLGSQSSNTMHQLLLEPRASSVVVSGSSGGFFSFPSSLPTLISNLPVTECSCVSYPIIRRTDLGWSFQKLGWISADRTAQTAWTRSMSCPRLKVFSGTVGSERRVLLL